MIKGRIIQLEEDGVGWRHRQDEDAEGLLGHFGGSGVATTDLFRGAFLKNILPLPFAVSQLIPLGRGMRQGTSGQMEGWWADVECLTAGSTFHYTTKLYNKYYILK